jgi:hypothetical protein
MTRVVFASFLLGSLGAAAATAQPATPPPCSAPEHRQFDFWVGDWDVFDPAGKKLGTNSIKLILNKCALHESWTGTGMSGHSYNIYFAPEKRWHQTWVDSQGSLLELNGRFEDGKMVLSGEGAGTNGGRTKHRLIWSKLEGGRLRQVWESSSDGGATWTVAFDGTYVPQGK